MSCITKRSLLAFFVMFLFMAPLAFAGEADIVLPDLSQVSFSMFGGSISGLSIMYFGIIICFVGLVFVNHPGKPDKEPSCPQVYVGRIGDYLANL